MQKASKADKCEGDNTQGAMTQAVTPPVVQIMQAPGFNMRCPPGHGG